MVNDIAVQEFVNAIKGSPQDTNSTYSATVSRIDDEGTVWVNIHGSDKETPTASTSTEVKRGDVVHVQWRNNKLYIGGNFSDPAAGIERVAVVAQNVGFAMTAAETAQYAAEAAGTMANNAMVSANGKNKIYRQATAPVGGTYAVGDIWFDTANDNQINRWDGNAWSAFTLGDDAIGNLNARHINAGEIDASIITVSNLDAGNMTTGVLNADRIGANSITASKMRIGDYRNYVTVTEYDETSIIPNTSGVISNGWVYKSNASASNLWMSPILNNWTQVGERYRVTGKVKLPSTGSFTVTIYGRDNGGSAVDGAASQMSWMNNIPANTETQINSTITISEITANCPKVNVCIYFRDASNHDQDGYVKQLRVERMSGSDLIVDGAVTADKLAANSLVIGKMDSATQSQVLNSNIQVGGRNYAKTNNPIGSSSTSNGITATLSGYSTITLNGTATSTFVVLANGTKTFGGQTMKAGTYKLWFTNTNGTNLWFRIGKGSGSTYVSSIEGEYTKDSPFTLTITAEDIYYVGVAVKTGATFSDFTTSIMWEKGNATTDYSPAPEDVEQYTDDVASMLSDSLNDSIAETSNEFSGKLEEIRTLANSKADSTALSNLSLQMQEYIGEEGYIYADNGTLIIATGQNIGNFKIGLTGQQIVFYENDVAVAYIEGKRLYISRSEVTDEQKISNFAFKKRDGGRFTLMYVGS